MITVKEKLVSWLFQTKALKVCPQDKPFWYTSGTIGPYYINTHFLYGNEEKATKLLKLIDVEKENKKTCSENVLKEIKKNYEADEVFKGLIDEMCLYIKNRIGSENIDYISGGERRDWYFSLLIAEKLQKPHITVFKDLDTVLFNDGISESISDIGGKNVLHIADIITEASSYTRAWIPAIKKINGNLKWSLVVVDRLQGGAENLRNEGVASHALVNVDKKMFDDAKEMGLVNESQYNLLSEYILNPKDSMRNFLLSHPQFLKEALEADERTRERANMCIDKELYGIKREDLL